MEPTARTTLDMQPPAGGAASASRARGIRFPMAVAVVVAVALAIRVFLVLETHYVPQTDARDYDREGVALVSRGFFPPSVIAPAGGPAAFRPPLYPLVLAGAYKLNGVSSQSGRWEAGRLEEAVLGALIVLLICMLALRLFGRGAALASGSVAAIYPPLVLFGSSLMAEPLFLALMLAAVLSALAAREAAWPRRWAALSGVLVGMGALTRGDGIFLVVPICALVWSIRPRLSLRSIQVPVIVAAATALTLVPWTVRNARLMHAFVPVTTETGAALAGTYNSTARGERPYRALWEFPMAQINSIAARNPRVEEPEISSRLTSNALNYIGAHPGYVGVVTLWSALRLLNLQGAGFERYLARFEAYPPFLASLSVYTFWAAALLALGGLLTMAVRRVPPALWACPAILILPPLLIFGATRYRAPADPFIVMLAAVGLIAAYRHLLAARLDLPSRTA